MIELIDAQKAKERNGSHKTWPQYTTDGNKLGMSDDLNERNMLI